MNQREKFQAQLMLLQELKEEFPKQFSHPYGGKYAELETQRENGILSVGIDFNQNGFESDINSQGESFFNEFICEIEQKLENAIEEEENAYSQPSQTYFGNPLQEIDEIIHSIKK
jgi:hypothetical protein